MSSLEASDDLVSVYVTFADHAEASRIASLAVEKRLAACANIFGEHTAIYRWKGAVETQTECAALFKTSASRAAALAAVIKKEHSYENPCISVLASDRMSPAFAAWIRSETGD